MSKTQNQSSNKQKINDNNEVCTDLLTLYIKEDENRKTPNGYYGDKFLRDTVLTNFIAGRDATSITLSWFFYLFCKNPQVASKIRKEVNDAMMINDNWRNFKEVNSKLVYLHAALCETLRLYSPVAFEAKGCIESDTLPSGHHVNPNTLIIFNLFAMGRTKSIWGDDCNEFKPERWISEQGKIRHEPAYKFFVFSAGPRTCLGKDMALTQMKLVVATIIQNYVIKEVEEHEVVPHISIFLRMKHGFKVKIRRC
ncbi:Alkane hydroxylase MAH1 [Bienertia sinuspersici]